MHGMYACDARWKCVYCTRTRTTYVCVYCTVKMRVLHTNTNKSSQTHTRTHTHKIQPQKEIPAGVLQPQSDAGWQCAGHWQEEPSAQTHNPNPNTHILTSVACRSMPQQQRRPAHLHDFCHGSCDTFYISDKFAVADSPEGSHSSSCHIEGRIPQNGNFSLTLAPAALNTASQPHSLDSHVSRHAALNASAVSMLCACVVLPLERRLDSLLLLRDSGTRIKIII
jgi:hypothetical protein